jgi:hypothetical protein
MRTAAVLIVGTALGFVTGCGGSRARQAISKVEKCTPGLSYEACRETTSATDEALPEGSLLAIRANLTSVVTDPTPTQPLHVVVRFVFVYSMQFGKGADCGTVSRVMEPQLGPPAHGLPPALRSPSDHAPMNPDAIYWVTEEGDWACSPAGSVEWYSLPLEGYDSGSSDAYHLDRFVKPAPKSAALWRKLGRALIER